MVEVGTKVYQEEIKKAGGKAAALGHVCSLGSFFEKVAEILKVIFNTDCFD
jgi:hypothetical protein